MGESEAFPEWLRGRAEGRGERSPWAVALARFEEWYRAEQDRQRDEALARLRADAERAVPELVGVAEATDILGVEKTRLPRWLRTGYWLMPEPVARLKGTPVWTRAQIEELKRNVEISRDGSPEEREALRRLKLGDAVEPAGVS